MLPPKSGVAKPVAEQRATYETILDRLHANGLIKNGDDWERWTLGRRIRNGFAHPTEPSTLLPSYAAGKLRATAEQINQLFGAVRARA